MNLMRTNLFAGCALGLLLVSGAGCVDALEHEPNESTDNLDSSEPVSATVAARPAVGEASANGSAGTGFGVAFPNTNPGEPGCAVDPVKPIPGSPRPPLPSAGTAPASTCSGGTIGDGSTCLTLDAIKLKASAGCEANGQTLVELSGTGSDDGRCVHGTTLAKYACSCAGAPKPVKPGEGAPSAGARGCKSITIGSDCLPYADLKLKAAGLCLADGLLLTDLRLGSEDCPGGASQSWASCCAPEPPPPATACAGGVIGDGRTCLTLDAIKLKASATCEAAGATLVELAGAGDASCPNGALQAKFACSCAEPGQYDPKPNVNVGVPPFAGKEPWLN